MVLRIARPQSGPSTVSYILLKYRICVLSGRENNKRELTTNLAQIWLAVHYTPHQDRGAFSASICCKQRVAAKLTLVLYKRCLITVSEFADSKMSLALFTICLISQMHGSEAVGGQCKTSERSVPGKALKGHTFKEFAARAIVECQNTCENDPRCASYNFYIPDKVCELNSQTKETRPDDFVTDELRFYMRREGTMYSVFLRCLRITLCCKMHPV